ncbi:actin, acrosomal process isoform-like [Meleagris gallopavo]|uniref:actin, acrosomal process isoform-like n=1 Tax=Meleagris gallopavo TaxID=9103 RepID=UPI00093F5565|nr:actin, acrosomal process isoform-like [Meleagris gallopavo]
MISGLAARYKDLCAVVIDTGMGHTRSGLAGDERPRAVVPSQGEDGSILTHGVVTDWDRLEELWHHIFYHDLAVCPEELAVLATDAPLSPVINREKVAELLFEGFGVPAMLVMPRPVLVAYSYGCTSGVVLGSGAGTSYAVAVQDGYVLPHASFRLDLAGNDLTVYLGQMLAAHRVQLPAETLQHLKETRCCCHPPGAHSEPMGPLLQDEYSRCAEALFTPEALGVPGPGLLEMAARSLHLSGAQPGNAPLLLAGGTTLLCGFAQRVAQGLGSGHPAAAPSRHVAAWLGGSIAASLDAFQGSWLPQDIYNENGPSAVHQHCF